MTQSPSVTSGLTSGYGILQAVLPFLIVLGLLIYFYRVWLPKMRASRPAQIIRVIDHCRISQGKEVRLFAIGDEGFLVGITESSFTLIHRVDLSRVVGCNREDTSGAQSCP